MANRPLIPGERHHWWPKSLSQYWTDDEGLISRIDTEGKISRSTPIATARISDGHNIRLGSPWDTTFEQDFDRPDSSFPRVVALLESLVEVHFQCGPTQESGYCAHACEESDLNTLCECLVSLAVRSPKFRQGVVGFVQYVRSSVPKEELKRLIAINMRQTYSLIIENSLGHGKFLVLFSNSGEFIYGDGFYHNLSSGSQHMSNSRILIPLTPRIAVLYAMPTEYMVEPRLVTLEAGDEMVSMVNETVQIYSKECLFYRFEQPGLTDYFLRREHLEYSSKDLIETLVEQIPGVKSWRNAFPFFDGDA